MSWTWLLPLPLAAIVVGEPMRAPRLRPPLLVENGETPCLPAVRFYLEAYAYATEWPAASLRLLRAAEGELRLCASGSPALAGRIEALTVQLRGAGRFPLPTPAPR